MSGYQYVTQNAVMYAQTSTSYCLECPAGKIPLSGSWDLMTNLPEVRLTGSELVLTPRPGWRFHFSNDTLADLNAFIGVLCVTDAR